MALDARTAITEIYIAAFNRVPDTAGLAFWVDANSKGQSLSSISQSFTNSVEYKALYPSFLSSTEYVSKIYLNVFARDAALDPTGLAFWVGKLDDKSLTQGTLMQAMLDAANSNGSTDGARLTNEANFGVYCASNNIEPGEATPYLVSITADPATVTAAETILSSNTGLNYTLKNGPDNQTANIFTAPQVYTPGGNDLINSIQDMDHLTGIGTNPTLSAWLGTPQDNGGNIITPVFTGIETIKARFDSSSNNMVLDLQDATGVKNLEVTRVADGRTATFQNIADATATNLSVKNSNAPTGAVNFTYLASALAGADAGTVTLNNVNIGALRIEENNAVPTEGFETLTVKTETVASNLGTLQAEDVQTLNITGDKNLTIRSQNVVRRVDGNALVEASNYLGGLNNMAGSLSLLDASSFTANLNINLNNVMNATKDNTSGTNMAVTVLGGKGNDTFIVSENIVTNDSIDGGDGDDTLMAYGGITVAGAGTKIEHLDVRTIGANAATALHLANAAQNSTVNTSLLPNLADVIVRNEGQEWSNPGGGAPADTTIRQAAAQTSVFTFTNMSAALAAGGINVLHGTTGNNALASSTVTASLATNTTNDSILYTLKDDVNADTRFNLTVGSTQFENTTISDMDTESNTVQLNYASTAGGSSNANATKITLTGGAASQFMNLDYTAGATLGRGVYGYSVDGNATAATELSLATNQTTLPAATAAQLSNQVYQVVAGAPAFGTATIDGTGYAGSAVVRVGANRDGAGSNQTITFGNGGNTVVFDASSVRGDDVVQTAHAGLTNGDSVTGGTGTDTLVVDGEHTEGIVLQATEWQNVKNMDQIYVVSNANTTAFARGAGYNYNYRIDITDALIDTTDNKSSILVRNDINTDTAAINNAGVRVAAGEEAARNANLVLDITNVNQDASNTNSVTYNGSEGGAIVGGLGVNNNRTILVVDENAMHGRNIIDGGDAVLVNGVAADTGTGNSNVIQVMNGATITVADQANVKNFARMEFINTGVATEYLTWDVDNTTLDTLIDSNHTASSTERETINFAAYSNTAVGTSLAQVTLNANTLTGNFNFNLDFTGGGTNAANISETMRIAASAATQYNATFGTNASGAAADTVLVYSNAVTGNPGGIRVTNDAVTGGNNLSYQIEDATGAVTGVVSTFTEVNTFDFTNTTFSGATVAGVTHGLNFVSTGYGVALKVTGAANNDIITGDTGADTISGAAGNDTITGAAGNDKLTGGIGNDTFALGTTGISTSAGAISTAGALADGSTFSFTAGGVDIITDFVTTVDKLDVTVAGVAPTALTAGATVGDALTAGATYSLLGTYSTTNNNGIFTVDSTATAGTANVAMIIVDGDNATVANSTNYVVLLGVSAVAAGDFV